MIGNYFARYKLVSYCVSHIQVYAILLLQDISEAQKFLKQRGVDVGSQ